MSRRFLTSILAPFMQVSETPIFPSDVTRKDYVDLRTLPSGGLTGAQLLKTSNDPYDVSWVPVKNIINRLYDYQDDFVYYGYEYDDLSWGVLRVDVTDVNLRTLAVGINNATTAWDNRTTLEYT